MNDQDALRKLASDLAKVPRVIAGVVITVVLGASTLGGLLATVTFWLMS